MHIMSAWRVASNFRLKFKKIRGWKAGRKPANPKVKAFIDLNNSGWPIYSIAELFKVSKQCVHQAIKIREVK